MVEARRVWLIRHGQSESNAGLPTNGPGASPLTPRGAEQAERVAALFPGAPALIVSSPFLRARQTARPTVERFPEAPYEEWPVEEFTYLGMFHSRGSTGEERRPYVLDYWERCDPDHVSGGDGESFRALIARVRAFLDRAAAVPPDGPVAVFSHGLFMKAVMWSLLTGVTDPTAADMRRFRDFNGSCDVANGAVVELWRPNGPYGWRVVAGATLHLAGAFTTPGVTPGTAPAHLD